MSWTLLGYGATVVILLLLFLWTLRSGISQRHQELPAPGSLALRHAIYFRQIRQALSKNDVDFLAARVSPRLARRVRKERRRILRSFLEALHEDFRELMQAARTLAALSPQVGAWQEGERLVLAARFEARLLQLRLRLILGASPLTQLIQITQIVGMYSARIEAAMTSLNERAMLAG
jgi:hypothetical protein